ncbi:MAG TPA: ABC-F family ATP-binding cassette domain-containing protein [Stellaceae bacterium]|nr:ABC-F family ATP-binding cassette domain-containing protein [Stellaceae bacterium]
MLTITDLTYRIAGRILLDEASAQIGGGQKVGLIGRNGTGKSTLFGLIMGELHSDAGTIELPSNAKVGIVAQEAPGGPMTPLDVVLAADTERAALLAEEASTEDGIRIADIHHRLIEIDAHTAPARAAAILAGLGFDTEMQSAPMSSFSGGWRMRVALGAVLFSQPDFLLLDEPTNHLDLEATLWLEAYLKAYPKTLLMISHDRHILNSVVDRILHLDSCKLTLYAGGYDDFEKRREERIMQARAAAAKQEQRRAHLQSFVDRFRAQATKARQAQSRLKMLQRLTPIAAIAEDPTIAFDFPQPEELAPPLISFDRVSVGYEAGRPILRDIDLRFDPEDRIALLGANGNGKSTLAKLIAGRLEPMTGGQHRSNKLRVGFFAQHQIEDMDERATPFELMANLMRDAGESKVRAQLGRFGFSRDKAFTKVGDLSGGERARLNFALITYSAPPMLIFDEPTNHLDIDSRRALAEAINDYNGAVIIISHDWSLLELTADRLLLVNGGKVTPFDGDLDEYRKLMLAQRGTGPVRGVAIENGGGSQGGGGQNAKQRGADRRKALEPLRRRAREAENALTRLNGEKTELETKLSRPRLDGVERALLMRRLADLNKSLGVAEEEWLAAEEALEQASAA